MPGRRPAAARPVFLFLLSAAAFAFPARAQFQAGAVLPASQPLHFVAFGDFGRRGLPYEAQVAAAIGRLNQSNPVQLGLTLGDNFYECGVRDVHDPDFHDLWEVFYGPLHIPFYPTFGNHDYGEGDGRCTLRHADPQAEIDYSRLSATWRMPAAYYTFTAGPVQFFALDTVRWDRAEGAWLETLLNAPLPPGIVWRVVYGHHPIYSSGRHHIDPRVKQLQRELLPLLAARGIAFYAAGHDHHLEHLRAQGLDLFIAGGGGDSVRPVRHPDRQSLAAISRHGFLDVSATAQRIEVRLLDTDLKSLEAQPWSQTR